MIQWSTNRVSPAVAARTAMPGTSSGPELRTPAGGCGSGRLAGALSRSAATTTQRASKIDDDDDKKPKEPLFSRDDDPNDDGLENPDANETDTDPDEDEDKDVQVVVVS